MSTNDDLRENFKRQRVIFYCLLLFVVLLTVVIIGSIRQVQEQALTSRALGFAPTNESLQTSSQLQNNRVSQNENSPAGEQAAACTVENLRMGPLKHAIGGTACYSSASFTCRGGKYDGKTFSPSAPTGSGGCLGEEKWKAYAATTCGCGESEDPIFGTCRYKKLEFAADNYRRDRVSCSRPGLSSCFYEAEVTCRDNQMHNVWSSSCLAKTDQAGADWEFWANIICCRNIEPPAPGEKPKACREFGMDEYGICSAYCTQRGFQCAAGGSRGLKCDDARC